MSVGSERVVWTGRCLNVLIGRFVYFMPGARVQSEAWQHSQRRAVTHLYSGAFFLFN